MASLPTYPRFLFCVLLLAVMLSSTPSLVGEEKVTVMEITPTVVVFSTTGGNVVASVGKDGALLIGTPSAASTAPISSILNRHTQSAVRYVVIAPEDLAHSEADAGWGRSGAMVCMQENALRRLGGDVMGAPGPMPSRLLELGVDRPRVAFSEVLAFDLNGEAIHVVHQKPGYSDADAIAHFHEAKLVYLGEVFPGDGYPAIDEAQGGTLDGLLETLASWVDPSMQVVPTRGPVVNGKRVAEFRNMIIQVRDHIGRLVRGGLDENQVVAEHPTAEFDPRWGKGRIQADDFVRMIYATFKISSHQP